MTIVKVFDPPMCCPTGTCGPNPDPTLARFAADLQWAQSQGLVVERYSLSQQPDKFAGNAAVVQAMKARGAGVLPIVMVNDQVIAERQYPTREELKSRLELPLATAPSRGSNCGCGPSGCC